MPTPKIQPPTGPILNGLRGSIDSTPISGVHGFDGGDDSDDSMPGLETDSGDESADAMSGLGDDDDIDLGLLSFQELAEERERECHSFPSIP